MNKDALLTDWEKNTEDLVDLLSHFTPESFNHKGSDPSWTAGQVAEHLFIMDRVTLMMLEGPAIPTNRPPDSKLPQVQGAMEDEETKRVAPDIVQPSAGPKDPQYLADSIKKQRAQIKESILQKDLTEACTAGKHPSIGTMTRLEWVYFTIYHTRRHLAQLRRLGAKTQGLEKAP